MATVFMELPVRFRNSLLIALVAVTGCQQAKRTVVIPDVCLNAGNAGLQQREGYLYYHNKKFSGRTVALYPNGDTAFLKSYYDGKQEAWSYQWYEGKRLAEKRSYSEGRKEGLHKGWWENGKLKFEYHFENDEHNGEAKEWFNNGNMSRYFHYTKGHEDGLEQMWWEDGAVRANYVVKNGEQYGLIGRKLCKNNLNEN
jgi:hypothetical protein